MLSASHCEKPMGNIRHKVLSNSALSGNLGNFARNEVTGIGYYQSSSRKAWVSQSNSYR
jgi:hypothetical protein